jgi:type I site-specific restriction endonuclease
MIVDDLKNKNNQIKELRKKLKQSPQRSILELEDILSSVADRKAFILLLDSFETEKSITRDLLESLIDQTYELNYRMIDYMENDFDMSKSFTDLFNTKNIKSILIFAIGAGIIISIVTQDGLAKSIIGALIPIEKEAQ